MANEEAWEEDREEKAIWKRRSREEWRKSEELEEMDDVLKI